MTWLLRACRCHSGAEPIKSEAPNLRAVGAQAFQNAIEEYESEQVQNESTEMDSIKEGDPVDKPEGSTDGQGGWVSEHGDLEVDGEHEFDGKEEDGMEAEDAFEATKGGGDGTEGDNCFENPSQ